MQDDEQRLFDTVVSPKDIVGKIREIHAELERKADKVGHFSQKVSKFVTSFCAFADKTSSIVMLLLPQSPEYTVTFGMLFLLFKVSKHQLPYFMD